MSVPIYQIGDLVSLKPDCWKHMPQYKNSVGLIVELGWHSQTDQYLKSFIVRFEELTDIIGNGRIVWVNDIHKHYPVVK
jgi:hypothetical protein